MVAARAGKAIRREKMSEKTAERRWREGDMVRIVRQPPNQWAQVVGEVGFVDEVLFEPYVQVQCLRIGGARSGCGGVPDDCLEAVTDPLWIAAKEAYQKEIERNIEESRKFAERVDARIEAIAARHGVTPETAEAIHREIRDFIADIVENGPRGPR